MNILIFDAALVPDSGYQQRIEQLFKRLADNTVRFATGILQAVWHTRNFRPDIIVFDWIDNSEQLKKLITMLHRIKADVAMFHLNGEGLIVTECPFGRPVEATVPSWLDDIVAHWLVARRDCGIA
jgi:hypothetical protein